VGSPVYVGQTTNPAQTINKAIITKKHLQVGKVPVPVRKEKQSTLISNRTKRRLANSLVNLPSSVPILDLGLQTLLPSFFTDSVVQLITLPDQTKVLPTNENDRNRDHISFPSRSIHHTQDSLPHPQKRTEIVPTVPDIHNPLKLINLSPLGVLLDPSLQLVPLAHVHETSDLT
jgi:hypothetical protein